MSLLSVDIVEELKAKQVKLAEIEVQASAAEEKARDMKAISNLREQQAQKVFQQAHNKVNMTNMQLEMKTEELNS